MKKSVVSLVLAAVACPALPADAPLDRLVGCTEIKDSRERLACFDREVAPMAIARSRASPAPAPTAPATQVARSAPPPATLPAPPAAPPTPSKGPERSFGSELLQRKDKPAGAEEEEVLHARIQRLRTVTANDFIVYLDNGQAWRHQDASLGGYLREGEAITISKGSLGSYRLTRDAGASKNWIRVTRIK